MSTRQKAMRKLLDLLAIAEEHDFDDDVTTARILMTLYAITDALRDIDTRLRLLEERDR